MRNNYAYYSIERSSNFCSNGPAPEPAGVNLAGLAWGYRYRCGMEASRQSDIVTITKTGISASVSWLKGKQHPCSGGGLGGGGAHAARCTGTSMQQGKRGARCTSMHQTWGARCKSLQQSGGTRCTSLQQGGGTRITSLQQGGAHAVRACALQHAVRACNRRAHATSILQG